MAKGRAVLITGAGRGIGYEIGKRFASNGNKVFLTDLQGDNVDCAVKSLRELGFEASGMACDVTEEEEIKASVEMCMEQYGGVDILVNNAGIQHVSLIEDFPTETFERLLKVMLTAPFMALKHVLPIMKKQSFGRVINMASINGLVGFAGKAAYNSAKHGVIGLTKVAALETAAHGITVNAVCPGYVDTPLVRNQLAGLAETRGVPLEKVLDDIIFPLVPQKRLLEVEEVADYVLFLASDQAKGITGQAAVIDGGYTVQ
ncbi:3-hydroxybutyrate dehydrogenase [Bacillus sp. REN3]|uniref:3-hydroxybutyrate dehydrogenase n=1 Tax=Bacillus sp. REN3 TaxID=2802440 RepID=UPI001AEE7ED4|nr:3-hydroxybutyrate dehydrogenase [Bacillus sp. REN3]